MTIGSNILHWRKYNGISQQELSQKANITQASISDIENGE
jgi:transcriptional regulator with XRE-family HTH domain